MKGLIMASTKHMIAIYLRLHDEMSKEITKAGNSLKSFSDTATKVGTQLSVAVTAPLVAIGVAGVEASKKFEQGMANIQAVTGITAAETEALGDYFLNLSMNLDKTTDNLSNLQAAYYDIASAGYSVADSQKMLEVSTKAATAGLTDTATAARGINSILQSYNLSVEHASAASDALFKTVELGVGSYEQLNDSLSGFIPTAALVTDSYNEVLAAQAALTQSGFDFAKAGTAINGILNGFINPSEAFTKMLNEMGYASGSAMIEALGFAGAVQAIAEYSGGSAEILRDLIPDMEGFRGMAILAGKGAENLTNNVLEMNNALGATDAAFAIMTDTYEASLANFLNTWNVLLVKIGDAIKPVLKAIMDFVTPIMQTFIALPEPMQTLIVMLGALLAAVGPVLIIVGQMASGWMAIATVLPLVSAALPAVGAGLIAALAPIMPLILALGLLYLAYQTNFLGIRDIVNNVTGFVAEKLSQAGTSFSQLGTMISRAWEIMNEKATTALNQLVTLVATSWSKMGSMAYEFGSAIISGLIKGIASKAVDLIAYVFGLSEELTQTIKRALGIASPSKVMMELGQQTALGFQKGVAGMGGIGVNVNGQSVNGSAPTLAAAGAGRGGGNTYYQTFTINPPAGTSREQIEYISKEIARNAMRKGAQT
jgi:TP901 family phage tail tape measure protein